MRGRGLARLGFGALWLLAMLAVGLTVYVALSSSRRSHRSGAVMAPHQTVAIFKLPGSLYLAHNGGIYRLQDGIFTELQRPGGWSQPSLAADGRRLAVVRRNELNYSDLYLLDPLSGQITNALTQNASSVVEYNHWSFYPRFSNDGADIFFSWDSPKDSSYRVDLAVWEVPIGQPQAKAIQWTVPNEYTGGDVSPVPINGGGLVYVKYAVDPKGQSYSQIWLTRRPLEAGTALTKPEESCAQPALSPDQTQLAMVCSADKRQAKLVVAPFGPNGLGAARTLIDGQLVAAPTWSPDGSGLVFLQTAADVSAGSFQLWWLPVPATVPAVTQPAAGASPTAPPSSAAAAAPRQVTKNLNFDALSPPAWMR